MELRRLPLPAESTTLCSSPGSPWLFQPGGSDQNEDRRRRLRPFGYGSCAWVMVPAPVTLPHPRSALAIPLPPVWSRTLGSAGRPHPSSPYGGGVGPSCLGRSRLQPSRSQFRF